MSEQGSPLAIDLYCGLGGWTEGLLAEGYDVIGFDNVHHVYGDMRYPAQLVLQDVLTLHGRQFREATLIVASPPCQAYSYRAMPWKRAKALPPPSNELFEACFRIQGEASQAAGRHIPLVVENVRGAQKWVGRSRWNFGSFHLWGDVPALMPTTFKGVKVGGLDWSKHGTSGYAEAPGRCFRDTAIKNQGGSWFAVSHNNVPHSRGDGIKQTGSGRAWFDKALDDRRKHPDGLKNPGIELSSICFNVASTQRFGHMVEGVKIARSDEDKRQHIGTKRKFSSAMIAKIPLPLSRHIAAVYHPSRLP